MKPLPILLGLAGLTILWTQTAFSETLTNPTAQPSPPAASDNPLYTQDGTDPYFAALLERGSLKPGERFSKGPVLGSRIRVNQVRLEKQVGKVSPVPKDIGLHTEVSGGISRRNFDQWTRWYQEDGNVQIFRLFKGEQNIRGGTGEKGSPGRVETFSRSLTVTPGTWREWEGTYTIVEPVGACIFQLFHEGSLWPMHIDMTDQGEIHFLRRRPVPGMEREISLAKDMVGKSIRIKVRANGKDYEVYQKDPLDAAPWMLVTKGTGPEAEDNKIQFRWGMYCGSKQGLSVPKDAMLFVTGVTIK
jgi:hypothetical protein